MNKERINHDYLMWMYDIVCGEKYVNTTYYTLFEKLYNIEFTYILPMDSCRAEDGIDLRYRFGRDAKFSEGLIASYLDDHPCSVLEMMVALAIRVEEHIMTDDDMGNRVGQWFWTMIVNLGLGSMDDSRYNEVVVEDSVQRFMNREIERDGTGGLFKITDPTRDMRSADIWYQMCWYLDEYAEEDWI